MGFFVLFFWQLIYFTLQKLGQAQMNTALYSELLSKCPALAGKKKQTNPNGFAELKARSSRREQEAGNTLVLLNGW